MLVAMGGAITNMVAVMHSMATYGPGLVQGSVLDSMKVERQRELYRSMDAAAPALDRWPAPQREDAQGGAKPARKASSART